jgi:hypothetical protein
MPDLFGVGADQYRDAGEAQPSTLSSPKPIGAAEKALAGWQGSMPASRSDLFSRRRHVLVDCSGVKHDLGRASVAGPARFGDGAVMAGP